MSEPIQRRTLRFWKERETRNTVVFREEYNRGDRPVVGTLYVAKDVLDEWGNPPDIVVVISPRQSSVG